MRSQRVVCYLSVSVKKSQVLADWLCWFGGEETQKERRADPMPFYVHCGPDGVAHVEVGVA